MRVGTAKKNTQIINDHSFHVPFTCDLTDTNDNTSLPLKVISGTARDTPNVVLRNTCVPDGTSLMV